MLGLALDRFGGVERIVGGEQNVVPFVQALQGLVVGRERRGISGAQRGGEGGLFVEDVERHAGKQALLQRRLEHGGGREFAASDVAVVTAGAKAILDLALTLETLETLGVPVIGLGTTEFPAFYSRKSGHAVPMSCATPAEVAGVMRAKWAMGLKGGVVVANPIPAEAEIPAEEIAPVIDAAAKKAERQGISGKETTPFLLAEIAGVTAGRSLAANIALAKHNASIAAEIAVAFAGNAS